MKSAKTLLQLTLAIQLLSAVVVSAEAGSQNIGVSKTAKVGTATTQGSQNIGVN